MSQFTQNRASLPRVQEVLRRTRDTDPGAKLARTSVSSPASAHMLEQVGRCLCRCQDMGGTIDKRHYWTVGYFHQAKCDNKFNSE